MDEKRIISDDDLDMVSGGSSFLHEGNQHPVSDILEHCNSENSPDGNHKWVNVGTVFFALKCEYCGFTSFGMLD